METVIIKGIIIYRNFYLGDSAKFSKSKSNNEIFFSYGFSRRVNSVGFYNKIILKRKDLTVNSR